MSLKIKLKNVPFPENGCPDCREGFKTPLHLKYHRIRVHNPRRPYVCKDCRKSFRRINELQEHSRLHREDESYECTVCSTTWPCRRLLERHMNSHINYDGDHTCSYCSASFIHLADARLHVLLVHDNTTVLPVERVRRPCAAKKDGALVESQFSVREGDGLKIRLKRKLSTDAADEHQSTCDLNPASQATIDSGKGNSDMDEEEGLRHNNALLRNPVFLPKQEETTPIVPEPNERVGSLLVKQPKFEVCKTPRFGSSQLQPGLNSSDFLSKTKFADKPSSSCFSSSSFSSAHSVLNGTTPFINRSSFIASSNNLSSPLNGNSVFRNPSFMNKPSFGSSPQTFGAAPPRFGKHVGQGFGSTGSFGSSAFGSNPSSAFGSSTSGFGIGAPKFFGGSPLNMGAAIAKPTGNIGAGASALFGSRQKVEQAVASPSDNRSQAFEQYAQHSTAESNPFAAAMLQAKRPVKKIENVDMSDSDSYSSVTGDESDVEEEEDSGVSEEHSHTSEERPDIVQTTATPMYCEPVVLTSPVSVNEHPPSVPAPSPYRTPKTIESPYRTPLPVSSPYRTPKPITSPERLKKRGSPRKTPNRSSSRTPSHNLIDTQPNNTPIREPNKPSASPLTNGSVFDDPPNPMTPLWEGMENGSVDRKLTESLKGPICRPGRTRSSNSTPRRQESVSRSPHSSISGGMTPTPELNGVSEGIGGVKYHIDMDTPCMSLSIPKALLRKTSGSRIETTGGKKTAKKGSSKSPAYLSPSQDVFLTPPAPLLASQALPPGKRVPSKPDMMKKRMLKEQQLQQQQQQKPKKKSIGPRSYMKRKNGAIYPDNEDISSLAELFFPAELEEKLSCARTDSAAPYRARFRENQKYLSYLRHRALDLIVTLFPHIRIGGNFCKNSDDVEGLLEYIMDVIAGKSSSSRCLHSLPSKRSEPEVRLCGASRATVKLLQRRICSVIRMIYPSLTLDALTKDGITTLPKLLHKVIMENSRA